MATEGTTRASDNLTVDEVIEEGVSSEDSSAEEIGTENIYSSGCCQKSQFVYSESFFKRCN